jgi:hypothetical protein
MVAAFMTAAREGDLTALIRLLHPDVEVHVRRSGDGVERFAGAELVARRAMLMKPVGATSKPALVDGRMGIFSSDPSGPVSVLRFVMADGLVTRLEITLDRNAMALMDLIALGSDR